MPCRNGNTLLPATARAPQEQRPYSMAPPPMPQPVAAPAPAPPPEFLPEPVQAPVPEPIPEPIPEPEPEPIPLAPEPEDMAEADISHGSVPEGMEAEDEILSEEELERVFGGDEEAPHIGSMVETDDDEPSEIIDPDEIPDDPIPEVFTATNPDSEEETGMGRGIIVSIAAAVLLVGTVAGAYFARHAVTELWPGAKSLYDMVDFSSEALGKGLEIRKVKSERQSENGVEILVVRGVIQNISEEKRPVPLIRVALYDSDGQEVQGVSAPPRKNELPPKGNLRFTVRLKNSPATARRLEVTFAEPPAMEEGTSPEKKSPPAKADGEPMHKKDAPAKE